MLLKLKKFGSKVYYDTLYVNRLLCPSQFLKIIFNLQYMKYHECRLSATLRKLPSG